MFSLINILIEGLIVREYIYNFSLTKSGVSKEVKIFTGVKPEIKGTLESFKTICNQKLLFKLDREGTRRLACLTNEKAI